ncbi:ScbR family autoregulator-binding transcription factor [Streptomyces sp. NPDC056405]|uniref:ScbR family autoregulator-binding transcription factor n=1 Tax=Streptomyces sp. NPDC056405 TaxID=3345811 RepID=UPI0035E130D1
MKKQERAIRTRHALIRSAAELFEQRGYVQARLAEISSGAGVSSGALHFHFPNKTAVADAVESEAGRILRRSARKAYDDQPNALQTLVDVSHVLAHLLRQDVVVRAGFRLNCDNTLRTGLSLRQEWQSCVQQLLAQAADEGSLKPGLPQRDLVMALVAATTGFEILSRENHQWLSRRSLSRYWRLLLPSVAEAHVAVDPEGTDSLIADPAPVLIRCRPSDPAGAR